MTSMPVGMRLAASALTCGLLGAALMHPNVLPDPAQRGLATAVNGATRFWLWVWDEPADALDNPGADWSAVPVSRQQTDVRLPSHERPSNRGEPVV